MKFEVTLDLDQSKQENKGSVGCYNGMNVNLIVTRASLSAKKLEIILEFLPPISRMFITSFVRIKSPKKVMCKFDGEINQNERRLRSHFSFSFTDMKKMELVGEKRITFSGEITHESIEEHKRNLNSRTKTTKREPKRDTNQSSIIELFTGVSDTNQSLSNNPYCGLLNQCSTCYLNVILQMLFHIPSCRNSILQSQGIADPELIALRKLFFRMMFVDQVSKTVDFTRALGWKPNEEEIMRDAQETFIRLFDMIEKNIPSAVSVFSGKELIHGATEPFNTIQLTVQGCKNIEESLKLLLEEDTFSFISLPNIFVFHLRRSIYNKEKQSNWKVCDYFEYKKVITVSNVEYELFQVIVHSGTPNRGHYIIYARPTKEEKWFMFNDSKVKAVSESKVFEENFGGKLPNGRMKMSSAYILIYIKKDAISSIFTKLDESKLDPSLFGEMEKKEEIKNCETQLFISCDDSLRLNAALSTPSVLSMKARRVFFFESNITLYDLYERIAEEYHLSPTEFRVWTMNSLSKLSMFIVPTLKERISSLGKAKSLYIERLKPDSKQVVSDDTIVLFVHFYFPDAAAPIQFIGNYDISINDKLGTLNGIVCKDAGFNSSYPTLAFSLGYNILELDEDATISDLKLVGGDLICFQLKNQDESIETNFKFEISPEQFERVGNNVVFDTVEEYISDFRDRVSLSTKDHNYSVYPQLTIDEILEKIADKTKGVPFMFEKDIPCIEPFAPKTKHTVTIEYAPEGCSLPLLYISDDAVQSRKKIHIPISREATFTELLEFLLVDGTLNESSVYRFLVIDHNQITMMPAMEEAVSKYTQIRVEEVPQDQLDVPKENLFPLLRGKINKNGTYDVSGEPFFAVFSGGPASVLISNIAQITKTSDVIHVARVVDDTATEVPMDEIINPGEKIIVMFVKP